MDIVLIFAIVSLIIFIGFFAEIIFKKTNVPDILILLAIGIILGTVMKLVSVEHFGEGINIFTTFALIFILFQGALNIEFKVLIKSLSNSFSLTFFSFIATMAIVTIICVLMGMDYKIAMLLGSILGGTSSAVVIPIVNNLDLKEKYASILMLESAISDVLCIVGALTIIEIIHTGEVVASGIVNSVLSSFSLAIFVGIILGFIWSIFLAKHENLTKAYVVTIAFIMGLYAFVESPFVGASGAIAVLAFGLVLGNAKSLHNFAGFDRKTRELFDRNLVSPSGKNFYSEISFFLKTFFFVYLGILIDFSYISSFVYALILVIGIYLVRPFVVKYVFRKDVLIPKERTFLEILIPKGLAAAVLAGVAVQSGVLGAESQILVNIVLSVILISIVLTSVLIFLAEKNLFRGFIPFKDRNRR